MANNIQKKMREKKRRDFKRKILKDYKIKVMEFERLAIRDLELRQKNKILSYMLEEYRRFFKKPVIKYWIEPEVFCPESVAVRCEVRAPDPEVCWLQARTVIPKKLLENNLIDVLNNVKRDFGLKFFEQSSFSDADSGLQGSYYDKFSRFPYGRVKNDKTRN